MINLPLTQSSNSYYHLNLPSFNLALPFLALCRDGNEPELAAVATGSHIDAIPYSGKYDGVVGVLGAIEAINVLKRFLSFLLLLIYDLIINWFLLIISKLALKFLHLEFYTGLSVCVELVELMFNQHMIV